ncbi:hypothetical protein GCM10009623_07850 [Nocardioides aestuarii]|uniref:RDD family protein n=1 Tax=Nocardioides aestuarii TaxID=252231 RepID=A0ABW4TF51_9ACTN
MNGQVPEGWYADPQDQTPGAERWWNGYSWTAHTRQRPADPAPPPVEEPVWGAAPASYAAEPTAPTAPATTTPTALPDGTPLAPLGQRLGAYAIDVVLVWFVASVLLGFLAGARLLVEELAGLDAFGLFSFPLRPLVIGGLWLGYQWLVLTRPMPSLGKRMLGLGVRRLEPSPGAPAGLDSSTAFRRALAGGGGVLFVMFPGSQLFGAALLGLDAYRMQQDHLRRPWHDQVAGTVVVRPTVT